jgi:hypothetical protein
VLIPGVQQLVAMRPQMTNYIANLMRRKPCVDGNRYVVNPELGFAASLTNMYVSRLTALI